MSRQDAALTDASPPQDSPADAPPTSSFVTNTPGATFTNNSTKAVGDLVLISSGITEQNNSPGFYYQEWFGEVRNASSSLYCYVNIQLTVSPGPGKPLPLTAYADVEHAYQTSGSTLSVPCIAPGTTGAFWANNISDSTANVAASTSFVYTLAGVTMTAAAPNVAQPAVTDAVVNGALGYDVEGTLTAVATISNIAFAAYLRDATGLIQARVIDTYLNSLAPSQSWAFKTTGATVSVASHFDTLSFITAVAPALQFAPSPSPAGGSESSAEISKLETERLALSRERAARAAAAARR
jgi:hypothetical protein